MSPIPVLGYPSKKAAIWALLDEGLSNEAIATKVDCSQQAVYVEVTAKRNYENRMKIGEKRTKALRIYRKALDVIADALDLHAEDIHTSIARLKFGDLETLFAVEDRIAEQAALRGTMSQIPASNDGEERDTDHSAEAGNMVDPPTKTASDYSEIIPENNPKPKYAPLRAATETRPVRLDRAELVTLFDAERGFYLNRDTTSVTRDRHEMWRGSRAEARVVRDQVELARSMVLKSFLA